MSLSCWSIYQSCSTHETFPLALKEKLIPTKEITRVIFKTNARLHPIFFKKELQLLLLSSDYSSRTPTNIQEIFCCISHRKASIKCSSSGEAVKSLPQWCIQEKTSFKRSCANSSPHKYDQLITQHCLQWIPRHHVQHDPPHHVHYIHNHSLVLHHPPEHPLQWLLLEHILRCHPQPFTIQAIH